MLAAVAPLPAAPRGPSIIVSPFQFEVVHNPAPQVTGDILTLQNMGFNWLDWSIGEYSDTSCTVPVDLPWLSVDQLGGTLFPNEAVFINVTFDSSVVPDGDYTGSLCVFSNDPFNPVVPVYTRLIVAYPLPTKVPPTPTEVPPTKVPPTPTEEPPPTKVPPTPTEEVPPTKVPPTPTDVPPATQVPPTATVRATRTPTVPAATATTPPLPTFLPTRTPGVGVTATATQALPTQPNQRYLPLTRRR